MDTLGIIKSTKSQPEYPLQIDGDRLFSDELSYSKIREKFSYSEIRENFSCSKIRGVVLIPLLACRVVPSRELGTTRISV